MNYDIREKRIEKAIAKKEYEQAEKMTDELYQEMPPIDTAMPANFIETIKSMDMKGKNRMNKKRIKSGMIATVALVAVACTSAFAVTTVSKYYKVEEGKLVQTTKDDQNKVMELTEDPSKEGTENMVAPGKTYNTLETAEKETGIVNLLPEGVQGYDMNSVSGLYGSQDKKQKNCKGISANFAKENKSVLYDYFLDSSMVDDYESNDTESVHYTNQKNATFKITTIPGYAMTGDEVECYTETMKCATVKVGKGQLNLSFVGLSDQEIHEVLEQVVLP